MSTLIRTFHVAFWFCVVCILILIAAAFAPRQSAFFADAAYSLPGLLLGCLVYAGAVGMLADRHSRSGALWGFGAFVLGPIGLVGTYLRMRQLLKSNTPATGSLLTEHSPAQKRWHWKLFIAFMVVLILGNIIPRMLR